jgi:hypothetical protein
MASAIWLGSSGSLFAFDSKIHYSEQSRCEHRSQVISRVSNGA